MAQELADSLTAERIDDLLRKWLKRLPHPFGRDDRAAGIRYELSMLQAEFALTQVFDRPVQGRVSHLEGHFDDRAVAERMAATSSRKSGVARHGTKAESELARPYPNPLPDSQSAI